MPTFLFRRSVVNALTGPQRRTLRQVLDRLDLGDPALMQAPGGQVWLAYDDPRMEPRDFAVLGVLIKAGAAFPDFDPDSVPDTRQELRRFVIARGIVWPIPGLDTAPNPYQAAYDAQGAPAVVRIELGPLWPVVEN